IRLGLRRRQFFDPDVGKNCRLQYLRIMGTDADPDIYRPIETHRRGNGDVRLAGFFNRHQELRSASFDPQPDGSVYRGTNFRSLRARNGTKLECGQTVTMESDIRIWRVCVEVLANGQHGLPVIFGPLADEMNFGTDREITGHALPDKVESVGRPPHI